MSGTKYSSDDEELQQMLRIPLVDFACANGWRLVSRTRGRYIDLLKDKAKLIISKSRDGSDRFYLPNGGNNFGGGILKFVQEVTHPGTNLGAVRQVLRPWIGRASAAPQPVHDDHSDGHFIPPDAEGIALIGRCLRASLPSTGNIYLHEVRRLRQETLTYARLRESSHGTIWFPHLSPIDRSVCGLEFFKTADAACKIRALKGSRKSLFGFGPATATRLVITESGIEALSKCQLDGMHGDTVYASTGGRFGPVGGVRDLIQQQGGRGREIIAAFNNDVGGDELTDVLELIVGRKITREVPTLKDWSKDLQATAKDGIDKDSTTTGAV